MGEQQSTKPSLTISLILGEGSDDMHTASNLLYLSEEEKRYLRSLLAFMMVRYFPRRLAQWCKSTPDHARLIDLSGGGKVQIVRSIVHFQVSGTSSPNLSLPCPSHIYGIYSFLNTSIHSLRCPSHLWNLCISQY